VDKTALKRAQARKYAPFSALRNNLHSAAQLAAQFCVT